MEGNHRKLNKVHESHGGIKFLVKYEEILVLQWIGVRDFMFVFHPTKNSNVDTPTPNGMVLVYGAFEK